MCNLYKLAPGQAEIAKLFDAASDPPGNAGEFVYPAYPGLVVADGRVRQMIWGFPLVLKGKSGQPLKPKPVNNARTDKLGGGFWRPSFVNRRCLIPVSSFAEAEGERGAKTKTWFALADEDVFAIAGIWRDTAEWGPAYAMVMTDANAQIAAVHDRMPVILPRAAWQLWTAESPDAALDLCRPYEGELTIERTAEPWVSR